MNKLKVCSLFAGVGGIDLAFEQTGKFETIIANEIDAKASETYRLNFDNELIQCDIREINAKTYPILTSCYQVSALFSIAGYRKGFEDETSGDLFLKHLKL